MNSLLRGVRQDLRFDTLRDFVPVLLMASFLIMLVVHPDVPARDLEALIALLRSRPDQLT